MLPQTGARVLKNGSWQALLTFPVRAKRMVDALADHSSRRIVSIRRLKPTDKRDLDRIVR